MGSGGVAVRPLRPSCGAAGTARDPIRAAAALPPPGPEVPRRAPSGRTSLLPAKLPVVIACAGPRRRSQARAGQLCLPGPRCSVCFLPGSRHSHRHAGPRGLPAHLTPSPQRFAPSCRPTPWSPGPVTHLAAVGKASPAPISRWKGKRL